MLFLLANTRLEDVKYSIWSKHLNLVQKSFFGSSVVGASQQQSLSNVGNALPHLSLFHFFFFSFVNCAHALLGLFYERSSRSLFPSPGCLL